MEPELPKTPPMEIADQPSPTSDAPPEAPQAQPDGELKITPTVLSNQEKAKLNERLNAMNDLTKATNDQLVMMGIRGSTPQDIMIFTMYSQVRHLTAMFDALCELLLGAPLLVGVAGEVTEQNPTGQMIGISPLNRENYFHCSALKAEAQVSMIRRQILSTRGPIPKGPGKKDS